MYLIKLWVLRPKDNTRTIITPTKILKFIYRYGWGWFEDIPRISYDRLDRLYVRKYPRSLLDC